LYACDQRGHRVPRTRQRRPFPVAPSGVPSHAVPHLLRNGYILPCAFAPLQSAANSCSPRRCSTTKLLPWGSLPLRDINRRRPPMQGSRVPHRSVLDVSHVLDGLLHHRPCRLVSSRCHVQGSLFRGFPPDVAVPSHRRPVPSWRWLRPAARRLPAVRHAPLPAFRACSTPGSVASSAGFSRRRRPIPS